jgi:ATP-dependent Zn protease
VPLEPGVSLERIAAETPGLVGAELRNLVNEAALLAARKDANAVGTEHFAEALQKITLGPARNILLNPADRERTASGRARAARAASPRGDCALRIDRSAGWRSGNHQLLSMIGPVM